MGFKFNPFTGALDLAGVSQSQVDSSIQVFRNGLITQATILSINGGDDTKFDVAAGSAVIDGSLVTWSASSANTVTNLATATRSYVFIDSSGNVVQSTTAPTPQTRRTYLYLGQLGHTNNTNIASVSNTPSVWKNPDDQLRDLLRVLGIYNASGNSISYNGSNLNINISSGSLMGSGINWENDENSPNIKDFSQEIAPTFRLRTQTGAGTSSTLLDVANYDNAGTITAVGGGANTSQNFRVYRLVSGNIVIQYGQHTYSSLDNAVAAIDTESFVEFGNLSEVGCRIGIISVKKTATDLSDTTQAKFFNAVRLGSSTVVNDLSSYLQLTTAASTSNGEGASLIGIEDAANAITATTVEGALAELASNANLTGDVTSSGNTTTVANVPNTATVTVKSNAFKLQDASDPTKQSNFVISGQTTGTTRNITIPGSGAVTLVNSNSFQTVTNKTMDGASNTFTNLPASALVTNVVISNIGTEIVGTTDLVAGKTTYIKVDYAGTITDWTINTDDETGSVVFDVWKNSSFPTSPTVANTITASAKPTLSSAKGATSSTLTGWTTTFAAGDYFAFKIDSISGITKKVRLQLKVTRT